MNLRAAARLLGLVAVLLVCLTGYALTKPFGRSDRWVRRFLGLAARRLGADVAITGRPLPRDVLFVANHVSWFDILAIGGATGAAFVSKDAVARWPVVGWLARIGGTIFIAREARAAARGQADAIAAALATGRPAAFFPEGTTGDGVTLLPFRGALFAAATDRGVPVQPIAIDYGADRASVAWIGDEPAARNALRLIGRRGRIAMTLHMLDPFDPTGLDRKQIAARARAAIAARLGSG